jgi:cobalt/nickel transport system permease protein
MHMADALLSPAVGGTMWAVSATTIACCSRKIRTETDTGKIPLMGVLGAFIFAAQMINFTIPATGSSGHLGGGLLLAILLGPHAAFLTIASVLIVQALFFADGGLLALGCNIFNLGVFPAFIAYPLCYRPIVGTRTDTGRIALASVLSAVVGLQLGAFSVVLETVSSGVSSLPFAAFVSLMQPIHLAIGLVEGAVTAAVIIFVHKARPEILAGHSATAGATSYKTVAAAFLIAALLTGGVLSWHASEQPDGLEWSINKLTGRVDVEGSENGVHETLAKLQKKTAILPDYSFIKPGAPNLGSSTKDGQPANTDDNRLGTSVSGFIGGFMTLLMAFGIGWLLKLRRAATTTYSRNT